MIEGRVIFHVDADAFFASVEQLTDPRLKGKPVVVCGLPLEHGVVTAASYEARPYGVEAGIPVALARKLLPDGYFVPVNIPKYLFFSTRLLSIYLQVTPRVEAYSVDEVFLDLTGEADPWCRAVDLKRQIARETGLTVSVGIGPNKLVPKIASDLDKPDGLTHGFAGTGPTGIRAFTGGTVPGNRAEDCGVPEGIGDRHFRRFGGGASGPIATVVWEERGEAVLGCPGSRRNPCGDAGPVATAEKQRP